ncbi:MAG: hypothetical protein ACRD3Y_03115 [Bryobacteraceae bacterium]
MQLDYDPQANLQHWPTPLGRFGKTPFNENLYRIVFAPSRLHLIGGEWADGSHGFRWVPRYRHVGARWILERWLRAEDYAQCSREKWDRDLLILGPWPARGEYDLCHVFEASTPDQANLEKLISWIEEGRKRRFQEHLDACRSEYDQETKDRRAQMDAIARNAISSFAGAPFVSMHTGAKQGRGSKTAPIVRTANELGLPRGNNKFINLRGKHVHSA